MSVDRYMAAREAFTNTKAQLKALSDVVAVVASSLQSAPRNFIFANQPIGLPMEASLGRNSRSVDADQWPSVEKIMRLLEQYHQQYSELESAWGAVPPNQQASLKSPDDLLGRGGYGY